MDDIKTAKQLIRAAMLEQRDGCSRQQRKIYSDAICERLWAMIQEQNARVIHCFLTMGSEVMILPLLQKALGEGLTVVVPKTLKKRQMQNLVLSDLKNMEPGIFGTYHPKDATEYTGKYDLIIVAGLAFDLAGYRVGYGGGYYDTFLAEQPSATKVGVFYPFQLLDTVPVEAHDVRLDALVY